MTLVLGLRCRDGVVLAADSQRTEDGFREEIQKLFVTPSGIVWGVAGSIAVQQELHAALDALELPAQPGRKDARAAIGAAVTRAVREATATIEQPSFEARTVRGLFAWHSRAEQETYLLRVMENGHAEFAASYSAVGARELALFALSQSEHLGYATLRLEAAEMVAFKIADDVIRASARGVGHPVQLAVVTPTRSELLSGAEAHGVADTLAAYREHQRDFLAREEAAAPERDTGIRPA